MNKCKTNVLFSKLFNSLPYMCVTLFYFIDLFILRILNRTHIDSDMSSMMVLSNQLNKEGTIISNNWFYATELRVINTQLLFKIALNLFPDNWSIARLLVQAVMLALYVVLLISIFKILNLGNVGVYVTAALISPIGYMYLWYVIFANLYLTHIIFCLIATVLMLLFKNSHTRIQQILVFWGGAVIAFLCSLNGIRYLMIYYVPCCIAILVLLISEIRTYNKLKMLSFLKDNIFNSFSVFPSFIYSVLMTGFAFCGYLYTTVVLSKKYPYQTMSKTMWARMDLNRLFDIWALFLEMFGYGVDSRINNSTPLFSLRGISSGFGVIIVSIVVMSLVRLFKRWNNLDILHKLLIAIFSSIFVVDSIVYAFMLSDVVIDNSSYWLHLLPYAFIIVGIEIYTEDYRLTASKTFISLLFLSCVIMSSAGTLKWFYDEPLWANVNMGNVKNYLVQMGYTKGYATFWNSNVLTELSDGQIEVWTTWDDIEKLYIRPWAQLQEHASTLPGSKSFVLIGPNDNLSDTAFSMSDNISEVYADEYGYKVFIFE